jgi:DNA-binding CsgD family transcriptional regulator
MAKLFPPVSVCWGSKTLADADIGFETYRKLTSLIYNAVLDQSRWQDFLVELTQATGGVKTHLFGFDIPAGISLGLTSSGYDPEYIETYDIHYGTMNAWAVGFAKGAPGTVLPSEWMCRKADLFKTEFYNDWIRPQEDVAAGGGAILFKDESRMLAFGGNVRLKDEERLEGPWLRTVGLLIPHLQQAFEISRALAGQSLELELLRKGAARGGAGVLLLADNGFILYANDAGNAMLREGAVLRDDQAGRATFNDPDTVGALEFYLKALRCGEAPVAATFTTGGGPGATPHIVRLAQFEPDAHPVALFPLALAYQRACLLVTINPALDSHSADEGFATLHGLTPAELAVTAGIAEGLKPDELADQRAVSIHTIRNQLKSALFKTGARRQADLVRMLERARFSGLAP